MTSSHSNLLFRLVADAARGERRGVTSVCSSHPFVIEAALSLAAQRGTDVLIEATCNQVNHLGGYTGMTPAAFRDFVFGIADRTGQPRDRIMLGGDHLGPNPWRKLPAEEAMRESERMVAAYVEAGFAKIHLDTSMACGDDAAQLADEMIAHRAARLAVVAEQVAASVGISPGYIVGTEVPVPGGAHENITELEPTRPEDAVETAALHSQAFRDAGIADAFERVVGLVVQPGVEFGSENVIPYAPEKAAELSSMLSRLPGMVFEAHSTDYQSAQALATLVRDGFAILKVGPGLTFAMREALYGLDAIARRLVPEVPSLEDEMERIMLDQPQEWKGYYFGSEREQRVLRHFSYSDRIRYYWPHPSAQKAVDRLRGSLLNQKLPETLIRQYLPRLHARVRCGKIGASSECLIMESIKDVLRMYSDACRRE